MQQHCNMRYGSPVGYNKTRLRVKGELDKTSHGMEVVRKKSDVQRVQSIYGVRGHLYADLNFNKCTAPCHWILRKNGESEQYLRCDL
jgi:hypothetical protein